MDILSEVLDALHLRAMRTRALTLDADHREMPASDRAVAYILLDGRCSIAAADEYALLPGDALLLLGGTEHALDAAAAEHEAVRLIQCVFAFERTLPHPLPRRFPPVVSLKARYLTDDTELGRTVSLLDGELINARLGIDYVALRLAEIVFVEMLRRCQLEGPQPPFLAALSDPEVNGALEAIHGQPTRPWQVAELAQRVGLSRAAFAERFHRLVGEPPLRYLRTWRLLKARRELQRLEVPVREVARHAGYQSSNGFSRAFRRLFGHPPSGIRHASASRTRTAMSG